MLTDISFAPALDNYIQSEQFSNIPDEEKPFAVDAFREDFITRNQISDDISLKNINEQATKGYDQYRNHFNIPRYAPSAEVVPDLYGSPIINPKDKAEDKVKQVEVWRDQAIQKASEKIPTLSEDVKYDVEDRANEAIRNILGEDNYQLGGDIPNWFADKSKRVIEGAIKPFYDLYDYKESQRYFSKNFLENPESDKNIGSDFASGIGQLATQSLIAAGLTMSGAPEAIPYTFGLLYGAQYMNEAYNQEMKRSGNKDRATDAAVNSLPAAALDTFSDAFLFHGLGKGTDFAKDFAKATTSEAKRELLKKAIPSVKKEMVEQFLSEGLIGGAGADIASNLGNYYATGDDKYLKNAQDITALARSAFVEGTLGAVFGAGHAAFAKGKAQDNISKSLDALTAQQAKASDILSALKEKDYNKVISLVEGKTMSPELLDTIRSMDSESATPIKDKAKDRLNVPEERQNEIDNRPYTRKIDSLLESLQKEPEKNAARIQQLQQLKNNFFDENGVPIKFESKNEFDVSFDLKEGTSFESNKKSFDVTLQDDTVLKNDNVIYVKANPKDFGVNLNFINLSKGSLTIQKPQSNTIKFKGVSTVFETQQNPKEGLIPVVITDGKIKVLPPVKSFVPLETDQQRADRNPPPNPEDLKQDKSSNNKITFDDLNSFPTDPNEGQWDTMTGKTDPTSVKLLRSKNFKPGDNVSFFTHGKVYSGVITSDYMIQTNDGNKWSSTAILSESKGYIEKSNEKKTQQTAQEVQKEVVDNKPKEAPKLIRFAWTGFNKTSSMSDSIIGESGEIEAIDEPQAVRQLEQRGISITDIQEFTPEIEVLDQNKVDQVAEKISQKTGKKVEAPKIKKPRIKKVATPIETKQETTQETPKETPQQVPQTIEQATKKADENPQWTLASLRASAEYQRDVLRNNPTEEQRKSALDKLNNVIQQIKELEGQIKESTPDSKQLYFDHLYKLLNKGQLRSGNIEDYIKRGFLSEEDLKQFAESKGFQFEDLDNFIKNWRAYESNKKQQLENNLTEKEKKLRQETKENQQRRTDQTNQLKELADDVGLSPDKLTIVNSHTDIKDVEVGPEDQGFVKMSDGHVYIILDNIMPLEGETAVEAAERVFKHEVVGHLKISQVLSGISPEGFQNLVQFLKGLEHKGKNVWDRKSKQYKTQDERVIVDEIFAEFAENRKKKEYRTLMQKILDWIRINFLKAGSKSDWTIDDMERIVQMAFNEPLSESDNTIRFSKNFQSIHLNSSLRGMYGAWITPNGQIDEVSHQDHFGYALEQIGEENATSVDQVYNELYNRGYIRAVNTPDGVFLEGHKLSLAQRAIADFIGINDEKNVNFNGRSLYQKPSETIRFSKISAGDNFIYSIVDYNPETNQLGKHKLPNTGLVDESAFKKMSVQSGELKQAELDFYKMLVPEAFQDGKVDVPNLIEGLNEKGPQMEVHQYGQKGKVSEAKLALDKMTHEWWDNLKDTQEKAELRAYLRTGDEVYLDFTIRHLGSNEETKNQAKKYLDLIRKEEIERNTFGYNVGPKATQYYDQISIFPKVSADGKPQPIERVDVVLPRNVRETPLWQQDDLHENLPNTLGWAMFQVVERNGKPTMVIEEVQSRWAQSKRQDEERAKASGIGTTGFPVEGHPLLDFHQSLVLKAAIAEARKRGIDNIALSDGETAMMTEGHDKAAGPVRLTRIENGAPARVGEWLIEQVDSPSLSTYASKEAAEAAVEGAGDGFTIRQVTADDIVSPISQDKGMRLAYDTTMPSILKKLTGEQGVKVDLGVHKNALTSPTANDSTIVTINNPGDSSFTVGQQVTFGRVRQEALRLQDQGLRSPDIDQTVQGSPVFRNTDGTPKTNATGLQFSLNNLTGKERILFSKREQTQTQEPEEFDFLFTDHQINTQAKSQASKQYSKLLKQKLEQKLIIKEKNVWNAFNDIQYAYLDDVALNNLVADLDNFVATRTRQENPSTNRASVDDLLNRLTDYKNKANQAEYDYWKNKIPDLGIFESFDNDIEAVRAYAKEALDKGEDAGIRFSDEEINYIEAIDDLQIEALNRVDDQGDIINRLFNESNNLIQPKGIAELDGLSELIKKEMDNRQALYGEYILFLSTINSAELSRSEQRKVYYSLLSVATDGYPNQINSFIRSDIQELLKQAYIFRNPYKTRKSSWTSSIESNPSQLQRLATNNLSSKALIQLQAPLREGLALAKRAHEQYITPYLERQLKEKFNNVLDKDKADQIGLFIHLRQRFLTEKPEAALKASAQWLLDSNRNLKIYDPEYRNRGERMDNYLKNYFFAGIEFDVKDGRIQNDFTSQDVEMFKINAEKTIGKNGVEFADSLVVLFDTIKPLSKFTTEFVYGRTFDEIENFVPSMSVIVKGNGEQEVDISQYQMMTDNKSIRQGKVGYTGINTTGSSTTKERGRIVGNNKTLVLNPMYLGDSVGRLAVYDYFTAHERQEISKLFNHNTKQGKVMAEWLGDKGQDKGRMELARNAFNNFWQNEIVQATYLHPWHSAVNWLARKRAQSVLSGVYQLPAQALSNTIPYFVQHINEPKKIGNYVKALIYWAKYKSGYLNKTQTELLDRILFEVKNRQRDVLLDKSINLDVNPNSMVEWMKREIPFLYKAISMTDKAVERALMFPFKLSDIVSGSPMMLAEYINQEQERLGKNISFDQLQYNSRSYIAALDDVERYIGIGDASRRGEWLTNKDAKISVARNLLIAFRSFSINNAMNFSMETGKLMDGDVSPEMKANSLKYMAGILSQSVVFNRVKVAIQLSIAGAIINALKNPDDEEKLKRLYRRSGSQMTKEQRKVLEDEISMHQQINKTLGKLTERNTDKRILLITTAKDAASNMFVYLNLDFIPSALIHFTSDAVEADEFKAQKEAELDRLQKLLNRNKNINNKETVAVIKSKIDDLEAQEFIPVEFDKRSMSGIGGSFGGTVEGILDATKSASDNFIKMRAMNAADALNYMAIIGMSQPDIKRYIKTLTAIEEAKTKKNEKEARLQSVNR